MINVNHAYYSLLLIVVTATYTSSLPLYTVSRRCSKRSSIAGSFKPRPLIVGAVVSHDMAHAPEQQFDCRLVILQLKSMRCALSEDLDGIVHDVQLSI
jgi:hypothetical protein